LFKFDNLIAVGGSKQGWGSEVGAPGPAWFGWSRSYFIFSSGAGAL